MNVVEVSIYKDKDDKEYIGGEKTPKGLGGSVHILLLAIPHKFGTAGLLAQNSTNKKVKLPRNHIFGLWTNMSWWVDWNVQYDKVEFQDDQFPCKRGRMT